MRPAIIYYGPEQSVHHTLDIGARRPLHPPELLAHGADKLFVERELLSNIEDAITFAKNYNRAIQLLNLSTGLMVVTVGVRGTQDLGLLGSINIEMLADKNSAYASICYTLCAHSAECYAVFDKPGQTPLLYSVAHSKPLVDLGHPLWRRLAD